jgi:hypothetical protein
MRKFRIFTEENLHKLNGLLRYLFENGIEYSAHYVKPTQYVINQLRQKNPNFNESGVTVLQVVWFEW